MFKRIRLWIASKIAGDTDLEQAASGQAPEPELQQAMAHILLTDILKERRSDRRWKLFKRLMITAVFIGGAVFYALVYASAIGYKIKLLPEFGGKPELALVRISGAIGSSRSASADSLIPTIKKAFDSKRTHAVVLQINSPGGAPVDAERIGKFVREMRKTSDKPVHAVIEGVGASAAYLIAMEADSIYAGRYSLVGSIGAILSTWDVHRLMARLEVEQRTFASGELKSMLNPFTPPSEQGDAKAQALVEEIGSMFEEDLMAARALKLIGDFDYSSGEVWSGVEAHKLGLVDEIGTVETVQAHYGLSKIRIYRPREQFNVMRLLSEWTDGLDLSFERRMSEQMYQIR